MKNSRVFVKAFSEEVAKLAQQRTVEDIAKGQTVVKRPLIRRKAEGEGAQ